jgi:hypothetical protein
MTTCEHCTQPIPRRPRDSDTQHAARRYCSRACYDATNRKPRPTAVCEHCSVTFGPTRHERPSSFLKRQPRYCSQACNGAAKSTAAHPEPIGRDCRHCAQPIIGRSRSEATRRAKNRFCSRACYLADLEATAPPAKTCPVCDRTYTRADTGQTRALFARRIHCSRTCAGEAMRRRGAAAAPDCRACGTTIVPGRYDTPGRLAARKYCNAACRAAHLNQNRIRKPAVRRVPARRRPAAKPRAVLTVFGDAAPAQVWRPAGFTATPTTQAGGS